MLSSILLLLTGCCYKHMAAAFRLAAEHTHQQQQQQQHSQDTAQILMHGRRDELMQLWCVSLPAAVLQSTPRHIPPSPD